MLPRSELQTAKLLRAPFWLVAISAATFLNFEPAAAEEKASLPPILSIAATAARTHSFSEFLEAVREAEQEKNEMAVAAPPSLVKALTDNVVTVREVRFGKTTIRQMMVAPNDPHFAEWQRQADARLKAESGDGSNAVEPSDATHVFGSETTAVICAAGCPDESGRPVYSAAERQQPNLATTQLSAAQDNNGAALASTAVVTLNGAFECLAGCYNQVPPAPTGLNLAESAPQPAAEDRIQQPPSVTASISPR